MRMYRRSRPGTSPGFSSRLGALHAGQVVAGFADLLWDRPNPVSQRSRAVIEVGEDERPQRVDLDGHQAEVGFVEILRALHLAGHLQAAVEAVDPAVIPTLQRLPVASRGHDLRGAVAAYGVEAAQPLVLGPGQKEGLVKDVGGLEIAVPG